MDHTEFNRRAWDAIARSPRQWFSPASSAEIDDARRGRVRLRLTATRVVPRDWLGDLSQQRILVLAGGGGHQGPLLAAAGGEVTVADISDAQLAIDRTVADAHGLKLKTVRRDMRDLGEIGPFDCLINPCSVNFCPDVPRVWREAFRVLVPGGIFMAGMINPINYLFDEQELLRGNFVVRHGIPRAPEKPDARTLDDPRQPAVPAEFGHSLQTLIGSQLQAGFQITDFFEDHWGAADRLSEHIAVFLATRARKPR